MFRFMLSSLVGISLGLIAALPASAAWTTTLEPINDGKGDAVIMLGEADSGRWFQLWCRGEERRLAILVNDGQNDDPTGASAGVEFAADTGSRWSSQADFYRHEANWLGLAYRNIGDLEAIVNDIIKADGNITAVILSGDGNHANDINISASAKGSTKAGKDFADKCFGVTPAVTPPTVAPPVHSTTNAAAWTFESGADPNGGTEVSLIADLDQGGYLYAYCDGTKSASLAFVSYNPQAFHYTQADTGLSVSVQVDGQETVADGEYFVLEDKTQGILFTNFDVLETLIRQIGGAQGDVAMMLSRTNDPLTTRWPAMNLNGLQPGAAQFIEHCWGATPVATPVKPTNPDNALTTPDKPETPAAPTVGGNWQFVNLTDDPAFKVEMTAPADNADATLRFACNRDTGTMTLAIYDRRGFAGDGAYEMTVSVDSDTWTTARTMPVRGADGTAGVISTDRQVLSMADQLSVPKTQMRVDLVHAMGAKKSYRFSASGSERPATDLYFGCKDF